MASSSSKTGKSSKKKDESNLNAAASRRSGAPFKADSKTSKTGDKSLLAESKTKSRYLKSESEGHRTSDVKSLKSQPSEAKGPPRKTTSKSGKDVSEKAGKTAAQPKPGSTGELKKPPPTSTRQSNSPRNIRDLLKRISEESETPDGTQFGNTEKGKTSQLKASEPSNHPHNRNEARAKAADAALSRLEFSKNIGFAKEGSGSSEQLAVQSVLFVCPLVSSEVLPSKYWMPKIISYLAEMSKTEKELAAVLTIRTLNSHKDKTDECVQVLTTYLKNVLANPEEEKYRFIKTTNKAFVEKVVPIKGAVDFLNAAGFRNESKKDPEGRVVDVLHLPEPFDAPKLEMLTDALKTATPILPQVFRDPMVLKANEAEQRVYLPDDFYDLTERELAEMYKKNLQKVDEDQPLLTKALREKEERKHLAKYKYAVLRIRFPDAIYLQGTFGRYDTQKSIKEFVDNSLLKPMSYSLRPPLAKQPLSDANDDKTLFDLKLLPAVVLNFIPEDNEKFPKVYLKAELLKKIKKL